MKIPTSSNRVFVSSTVYDLIDIRAEVEDLLEESGLTPVMSDSKNDGFDSTIQENSIETCLVNLRNCPVVILILDQRYGPSLSSCGFSDHSATHLEYLDAKKNRIPIYVYARDKLLADYSIWKRIPDKANFKGLWVNNIKDTRIFEIIGDRSKLEKDPNWISTFTNSVDLKKQILRDLKVWADEVTFWKDFNECKIPLLFPSSTCEQVNNTSTWKFNCSIKNCGFVPAIEIKVKRGLSKDVESEIMLPPSEAYMLRAILNTDASLNHSEKIEISYKDTKGRNYQDIYESTISGNVSYVKTGFKLLKRIFFDANGKERIRATP
jgi:hypothetical protein